MAKSGFLQFPDVLPGGGVVLLKAPLQLATNSPGSSTGSSSSPFLLTRNPSTRPGARCRHHPPRSHRSLAHHPQQCSEEASIIVVTLLKQYNTPDKLAWGYDTANGEYVDMIKMGIVNLLKVVRTAIVDASGVASLLTTSEVWVVDAPEGGQTCWRYGRHTWYGWYGGILIGWFFLDMFYVLVAAGESTNPT